MSINNKRSYTEYTVTQPTTDFAIGFDDYDEGSKDIILVTLNGVLVETLGYAAMRKNESTVTITPAITEGTVRLTRETDIDEPFHKFTAGALFSAKSVDENFQQVRHSQQEVRDGFEYLEFNTSGIVQEAKTATNRANEAADVVEGLTDAVNARVATVEASQEATVVRVDNFIATDVVPIVNDAINSTAVEGGVLADTFLTVENTINQRQVNRGFESIVDLTNIANPKNGLRVYVKSYHAGLGKGGGYFTYDSSRASENDGGSVINGWLRIFESKKVTPHHFGVIPAQDQSEAFKKFNDFIKNRSDGITIVIDDEFWAYPLSVVQLVIGNSDITRPAVLTPPSNSTVVMTGNGKLTFPEKYPTWQYGLISISTGISNVNLINCTVDGLYEIGDVGEGEWGMGYNIYAAKNIALINCKALGCAGDGLYIGSGYSNPPSSNITVANMLIDTCARQGISVTDCIDLFVSDILIKNISGRPPQCGIDIEINHAYQYTQNLHFNRVRVEDAVGGAFKLYLAEGFFPARFSYPERLSLFVNDFVAINSEGISLGTTFTGNDLNFNNVYIDGSDRHGLTILSPITQIGANVAKHLKINNISMKNLNQGGFTEASNEYGATRITRVGQGVKEPPEGYTFGGVSITNYSVDTDVTNDYNWGYQYIRELHNSITPRFRGWGLRGAYSHYDGEVAYDIARTSDGWAGSDLALGTGNKSTLIFDANDKQSLIKKWIPSDDVPQVFTLVNQMDNFIIIPALHTPDASNEPVPSWLNKQTRIHAGGFAKFQFKNKRWEMLESSGIEAKDSRNY